MILGERYELEKELGRGGFGVVFLARDRRLHSRRVVVKIRHEAPEGDEWFRKKFEQEIEALARIDHPGVVGALDYGETREGKLYLVMQYVEGVTLGSLLTHGRMALPRAGSILRQIGQALEAAHEKGVFHRDLKPANIMLQDLGQGAELVKLIDFGIATVLESEVNSGGRTTRVAGSFGYMAPEQLQGKPSASSDIYAMGVIAYELVTGERPFTPATPFQLLELQRRGVAVRPKDIRADLPELAQQLIVQALSFDEHARPARAREFGEKLAALIDHPPPPRAAAAQAVPYLEVAHVLFMDLVGYSRRPIDEQTRTLGLLQETVRRTVEYRAAQESGDLLSLPTGDGMALVFFRSPEAPARCAIEVAKGARQAGLALRMGIHTGPVHRVADINASANVAGGGINMAQRVMDCGDAGHILVSRSIVEVLGELSTWTAMLEDLGEQRVKHGQRIRVFNLVSGEAGNRARPSRLAGRRLRRRLGLAIAAAAVATSVVVIVALWQPFKAPSTSPVRVGEVVKPRDSSDYVWIPPGSFEMGCVPSDMECVGDEKPRHRVTLTKGFWVGETEVTVGAYKRFAQSSSRAMPEVTAFRQDENHPMVNVRWEDATAYCRWAGGRLPREVEWEYAARGGKNGLKYPWGNTVSHDEANYEGVQGKDRWEGTAPVRSFAANGFGLYDMAGNVWEWVQDWYDAGYYKSGPTTDPKGPASGEDRVLRGGSWGYGPAELGLSFRFGFGPGVRLLNTGIRCVRD